MQVQSDAWITYFLIEFSSISIGLIYISSSRSTRLGCRTKRVLRWCYAPLNRLVKNSTNYMQPLYAGNVCFVFIDRFQKRTEFRNSYAKLHIQFTTAFYGDGKSREEIWRNLRSNSMICEVNKSHRVCVGSTA